MLTGTRHRTPNQRPLPAPRGGSRLPGLLILLCGLLSGASVAAETTFVTVENRSGQFAKIALPGARPARVPPDTKAMRVDLEVTRANGVEAKAWWVSNPRQLCVIFVRYEGHVVIAGDKNIHCLGH